MRVWYYRPCDDAVESDGRAQGDALELDGDRESELHRVTVDSEQCGGRPCLRGLRVRVKDALDLLATGVSRDEIPEDYPYLEAGDVTAALEYAARQVDHPVLRVS